jgi:predicted metal-dependent peptidase
MARRRRSEHKEPKVDPLVANRRSIGIAITHISRSPLGVLYRQIRVEETGKDRGAPKEGAVDPVRGIIFVNPHLPVHRSERHWAETIAHLLLHLGLNHAARCEERDPFLWSVACEEAVDALLPLFGLARREKGVMPEREEQIYERLIERVRLSPQERTLLDTPAGTGRMDILGLDRRPAWKDQYENALGEGIRLALEETLTEVAEARGEEAVARGFAPAERARRWVMNEFPLLGALSTQIKVIADQRLCERMDISVAAVNGYLGEMYFHPGWALSQEEWTFIYVHELLHVALLHHTRSRGRNPLVWNLACDFVINGWLVEMGVGTLPSIGALYDPRLAGMSADEVYDLLERDPKLCKGARGFRGRLGDVLLDGERRIYRDDVTTLDDVYRRCMQAGYRLLGRGLIPAGLLEEIRSLFAPPPPWDVELGRWLEGHVPLIRESLRSYARASRRQSSTPEIPRPARYVPHEWKEACTFGVVMDTSGSMDRELLGRALGAIASYCEAREVPRVRLIMCDATPYDQGFVAPTDLRGAVSVRGRGGTVLQPAINLLLSRPDFPPKAPVMVITDGWCEETITCPREHCFVFPRKRQKEGGVPLRTSAPVFRVLKEEHFEEDD